MSMLILAIPSLPICAGIVLALFRSISERWTSRIAVSVVVLFNLAIFGLIGIWLQRGSEHFQATLFRWESKHFDLDWTIDRIAAVFLGVTAMLGGLVTRFSHYYMHREPGHRRFFATLLIFLGGMAALSLSSDIESIFVAWEIVGIASFLLIGFYRERIQPIRNALRVYSIYRLCDVGLLLGLYMQHYHSSTLGEGGRLALSALILLSAAGKSAQFPFSYWVPRAMEGPTPSSAIFYGALSIHAGVLLLLRTQPIWSQSHGAPWLIGGIGLLTAILATGVGRVQSNIKGQIGYASVTQVGLMFVEVASGHPDVALIHFVGNACLRCYQLLVSPSIVVYLLRLQGSSQAVRNVGASPESIEKLLPTRIRSTLYAVAISDAYLETLVRRIHWDLPRALSRLATRAPGWVYGVSVILPWLVARTLGWDPALSGSASFLGLALVLSIHGLDYSRRPAMAWTVALGASLALAGAVVFARGEEANALIPFAASVGLAYVLGIFALSMRSRSRMGVGLLSFLAMIGFPISPAFFGEDLLLDAAIRLHPVAGLGFALVFIVNGIALSRAFAWTFLKLAHPPVHG